MLYLLYLSLLFYIISSTRAEADEWSVERIMKDTAIVPELLKEAPQQLLKILYENDLNVGEGKNFTPSQLKSKPELEWEAELNTFYTIIMLSPDAPRRDNPIYRSWLHWLVVNVPGMDVDSGQILAEYFGPLSPKEYGYLRYAILVYEQPTKLEFEEKPLDLHSASDHSSFDVNAFTSKYNMNNLLAGNVFKAEWDSSVPDLTKSLYGKIMQ